MNSFKEECEACAAAAGVSQIAIMKSLEIKDLEPEDVYVKKLHWKKIKEY